MISLRVLSKSESGCNCPSEAFNDLRLVTQLLSVTQCWEQTLRVFSPATHPPAVVRQAPRLELGRMLRVRPVPPCCSLSLSGLLGDTEMQNLGFRSLGSQLADLQHHLRRLKKATCL